MKGIFEGIKVLDFSWALTGPRITRYLADQGAQVLRVETASHTCIIRQSPPYRGGKSGLNKSAYFGAMNPNKMSLGIDIRRPEGMRIIKMLVGWADIVIESFAPGIMEKLGLTYEELRKIKPDVIVMRTSLFGNSGPMANVAGFGVQMVGHAGFTNITGWPDRTPSIIFGAYTDFIAPRFGTTALIGALLHRRRTGKGMLIELSQHEAAIHFLSPILMDYQVNARIKGREGNVDDGYCPHGLYPCQGQDRWIAIVVTNDREWSTLARLVGEDWTARVAYGTLSGRKADETGIDSRLSKWTSRFVAEELMVILQKNGVPAGVAKNGRDILEDPQLAHREAIWYLDHEEVGKHNTFALGFALSDNPPPAPKAAPLFGEHTFQVCKEILGLPDDEVAGLIGEGILQV